MRYSTKRLIKRFIINRNLWMLLLSVFWLSILGCAEVNHVRQAQDAFNQAATAENSLRFDLAAGTNNAVAINTATRAGYTSVLVSIDKLSDNEKASLKEAKLWGNVLTLKAMSEWRLQLYDKAAATAIEALKLKPDELHPRDRALMKAMPALIRIDQVYAKIYLKKSNNIEFKPTIEIPLINAADILADTRKTVAPDEPVQLYLIQAQLAAYRNLKIAYRVLRPGRDTVPNDNKLKKNAPSYLKDLNDVLLVVSGPGPTQAKLIKFWASITNLKPPPPQ